jgi:hypothetical protein
MKLLVIVAQKYFTVHLKEGIVQIVTNIFMFVIVVQKILPNVDFAIFL